LLIIWFHPACLFGGIICASQKKKLLPLLCLLPPLLCTIFTGARAAFLIGLACWLGGYWAVLNLRGITRIVSLRRVLLIGVIAASLFGMFFFVDYVRGSLSSSSNTGIAAMIDRKHLYDYMFGSPAAFSKWFASGDDSITGGAMTFPSVFEAVGAKQRYLGLYDKEVVVISGYFTNLYTVFRGLVQDFTFPGAICVCLLFGYWSGTAYRKRSIWLSLFYAVMLYSPIVCLFVYNGTILAWAALAFCVYNIRLRTAIPFIATPEQSPNG
jgi:oligosaccharide repeat unit polymerase